jgi:hypothetical protein
MPDPPFGRHGTRVDRFVVRAEIVLPPELFPSSPYISIAHAAVSLWRRAPKTLDIVIDIDSTTFTGDGTAVDAISTTTIVRLIAGAARSDAIERSGDDGHSTLRVWVPSTIHRSGSGLGTRLRGSGFPAKIS